MREHILDGALVLLFTFFMALFLAYFLSILRPQASPFPVWMSEAGFYTTWGSMVVWFVGETIRTL